MHAGILFSGNVASRRVTHSDNSATRASCWAAHLVARPSRHQPGLRRRRRVVGEPNAALPAGLTEEVSRRWGRPGEGGSRPPLRLYELVDELCQDRRRCRMRWSCQNIDTPPLLLEREGELTKVDLSLLCKQKANCQEGATAATMKAARASDDASYMLRPAGHVMGKSAFFDIAMMQQR